VYEQLNAPFGQFGMASLVASTRAVTSTDDGAYNSIETSIQDLTTQRDALALTIETALDEPGCLASGRLTPSWWGRSGPATVERVKAAPAWATPAMLRGEHSRKPSG
jgi:hypothetical protein